MFSPDQFFEDGDCFEYKKNFIIPLEFVEALSDSIDDFKTAILRDIKCKGYVLNILQ